MREMFRGSIGFFRVMAILGMILVVAGPLVTKPESSGQTSMQFVGAIVVIAWILAEIVRALYEYVDWSRL